MNCLGIHEVAPGRWQQHSAAMLGDAIERSDVTRTQDAAVHDFYRAAPGGVRTTEPFSQSARNPDIDLDRTKGAIRDVESRHCAILAPYGGQLRERDIGGPMPRMRSEIR